MSLINYISERVLLPIFDLATGLNVNSALKLTSKSQHWSYDQLVDYQNIRLKLLMQHAYKNVPFYKNLLTDWNIGPDEIKTIDDLVKLPIITKDMLRNAYKNNTWHANNVNYKEIIASSSSGSTGEPFRFFHTKQSESMKKATAIRGWSWMGYRLGDKILRISQIPRSGKLKDFQDIVNRTNYFYAPIISNRTFDHIITNIHKYKPLFLRSYPDPLHYLCHYMLKKGVHINHIKAINTTGSMLSTETRQLAKNVFNCEVYDSFSCEGGAVVFEGPEKKSYYSAMEYAITEVVNNDQERATKGRLITTDLWNYATPFIRYDTQDVVELLADNQHSTFGLLKIKSIYGRESDVLVTPDGQLITANNFTGLFQWVNGIDQFQIHQQKIDTFCIYVKPNEKYNYKTEIEIEEILKKVFSKDVTFTLVKQHEIEPTKSGKRRFLIRDSSVPLP